MRNTDFEKAKNLALISYIYFASNFAIQSTNAKSTRLRILREIYYLHRIIIYHTRKKENELKL